MGRIGSPTGHLVTADSEGDRDGEVTRVADFTARLEMTPESTRLVPDEPIAREAYDRLADAYAARVEDKAHNAYYDRPAVLSLLPSLHGKRVLDAGCGTGTYTAWLAERGAHVLGLDVSARMLEHAERRLQGRAAFRLADLGQPLDFLPASEFDLVVSGLAFDHVRDWDRLFVELFRVLRDPAHIVFSVAHPFDEYYDHHPSGSYFDLERVETVFDWKAFGVRVSVPYYRRSLGAMLDPLLAAGFRLERLLEPRPTQEFRIRDPDDYAKLMRKPGFICVRATKDSTGSQRTSWGHDGE